LKNLDDAQLVSLSILRRPFWPFI